MMMMIQPAGTKCCPGQGVQGRNGAGSPPEQADEGDAGQHEEDNPAAAGECAAAGLGSAGKCMSASAGISLPPLLVRMRVTGCVVALSVSAT